MPIQVEKEIVVLDSQPDTGNDVGEILADLPFRVTYVHTLVECETRIQHRRCYALILDLDTVDIDNRGIVQFKRSHPEINIIAKSALTFHPELEESLRSHIFACLSKPLDSAELHFWLRSLASSNGSR